VSRREPHGPLVWLLGVLVATVALFSPRPTPRLPPGVDQEDLEAGYERSDMRPRAIIAGAVVLLLILGVALVLVTTLETALTGVPPRIGPPADLVNGLQAAPRPTPPAPALEAEPGQFLGPYMAAEQQKLSEYRWVDRQAGIAAMPIDRAIDAIAQQGLPARSGTPAGVHDAGSGSPSSASSGRVDEAYP
jgi:hypothetical protein